ncbi:glucose 1-dehydrogenase [Anderseniella sp. Alg231-50]|uniref:glucose 1-dehydrogenase n=1 Tax=Anderseniella sp. Alg231-50 TaxID=1922226 RepID=UPI000D55D377
MHASKLFDLSGEVALVTGASSGLGERFAEVLAAHGASVVVAARRADRLASLVGRISDAGGKAQAVELDVSDQGAIAGAFDAAETAFGTVTILVNNAGVAGNRAVFDVTPEDWRKVMSVNLDGVWFAAQEAARRMKDAGRHGNIINIASVLSFRAARTVAAYAASKGAVLQLTRNLALEFARYDIRVNGIAPGYILTEINKEYFESDDSAPMIKRIPQRRIGDVSDLDGTLLLLASNKASGYMTGSTVVVDGGHLLPVD